MKKLLLLVIAIIVSVPAYALAQATGAPASAVSPELFATLCGLGAAASLGIQHALQSGKWPPKVNLSPLARGALALLPGAGNIILITAMNSGHFDQHALSAGLLGMTGALQGLFAAFWPSAEPAPEPSKPASN